MEREKKLHIELLRMLAILLVVFNHTEGYAGFAAAHESAGHWPWMLFSALCKCAVPIFFMCSGALLLGKDESAAQLLKKRVLRFALVLLLFSFVSVLYEIHWRIGDFSPFYFLRVLWAGPVTESYWFLYRYIGFLLALPLLRKLARAMEARDYRYLAWLLLAAGLAGLLPPLLFGELLELSGQFVLFFVEYTVCFPLLGYCIEKKISAERFTARNMGLAVLAGFAALLLMCAALERFCRHNGEWLPNVGELFFGRLNFIPAVALYVLAKGLFLHWTPGRALSTALRLFGGCSFGVYLIQHVLLSETAALYRSLRGALGVFGGSLVRALLVCLLGTAVTWLLKRVPGLKKLL